MPKMLIEKSKPKRCYAYYKPYIAHNNQFTKNFVPHNSFIGILEKQNTSWGVDPLMNLCIHEKNILELQNKTKNKLNFYVQKLLKLEKKNNKVF